MTSGKLNKQMLISTIFQMQHALLYNYRIIIKMLTRAQRMMLLIKNEESHESHNPEIPSSNPLFWPKYDTTKGTSIKEQQLAMSIKKG